MISVRLIDRTSLQSRLAPWKCRKVSDLHDGLELWETGWGEPFTVTTDHGHYDEWQYLKIIAGVITETIPDAWET